MTRIACGLFGARCLAGAVVGCGDGGGGKAEPPKQFAPPPPDPAADAMGGKGKKQKMPTGTDAIAALTRHHSVARARPASPGVRRFAPEAAPSGGAAGRSYP